MTNYTSNPVADAQEHTHQQDARPYEYDYTCDACKEGFDHSHGVEIGDEKFCNQCVAHHDHIEFYRQHGLTAFDIYEATNSAKDL